MPRSPAFYRPALIAVVGLSALGGPAVAQRSGAPVQSDARLQGVVVAEHDYQPVESATVTLVGTRFEMVTGRWGSFAFPEAPLGTVEIQVSAPGHPSVVQSVEVTRSGIAFVQIVLPSVAAVLSELLVQGRSPHEQLADAAARTAADLLALQVPRARVSSNSVGRSDYDIQLRGTSSTTGSNEPIILIDGVMVAREEVYQALLSIPATDVEEIQVLKGPAAAALYPYAANGVINVRTKR